MTIQLPTDWAVLSSTANGKTEVIFDKEGNGRVSAPGDEFGCDLGDSQIEDLLLEKFGVTVSTMIAWGAGESDYESVGTFCYEVN